MHAQHAAKDKLFGANGLRASNFKMFPGKSRETSAEQVAAQLIASIERIEAGQVEIIEEFED
ncbi:hypothetical protein [Stenotrophomonas sp.]|uniref:hypothetical protein n=1 Tax=Stenotrophomonas sp. TaxID=69392 RepID=UPI0028A65301|nr:hypothetical protein [Stenotrophomonas sp.]